MGKRFNNLEDVYNTLSAQGFNFSSLPANNKYRKYAEWKRDPERRQLPAGSAQNTGDRAVIAIYPFGLDYADASKTKLKMSGRASNLVASVGGAALYNHLTGSLATINARPGFVPAKAILSVNLAGSVTVSASQNRITGRAYKKRTGESYTIPFGPGVATEREFDVQEQILTDRAATHTVTFTPERLRRG